MFGSRPNRPPVIKDTPSPSALLSSFLCLERLVSGVQVVGQGLGRVGALEIRRRRR